MDQFPDGFGNQAPQGQPEPPQQQQAQPEPQQPREAPPAWVNQFFSALRDEIINIVRTPPTTQGDTPSQPATQVAAPVQTIITEGQDVSTGSSRHKIGHPDKFDGVRKNYRPWKTQVEAKLFVDLAYEPELTRFWYVYSRLDTTPTAAIQSWIEQQTGKTVEELYGHLGLLYDDLTGAQTAVTKLRGLKQGKRSFQVYLTDFEKTLMDAGALGWPDDAKKSWLGLGLADEIVQARLSAKEPESYIEYVNDLHNTAANIYSARKMGAYHPIPVTSYRKEKASSDTMDWEPTRTKAAKASYNDDKKSGVRAKWVSQETLTYRKEKGLCFRCGSEKHRASECKLLPAVRPVSVQQTAMRKARVEEVNNGSDGDDGSESENEEAAA